jgi:hypothetical protein
MSVAVSVEYFRWSITTVMANPLLPGSCPGRRLCRTVVVSAYLPQGRFRPSGLVRTRLRQAPSRPPASDDAGRIP